MARGGLKVSNPPAGSSKLFHKVGGWLVLVYLLLRPGITFHSTRSPHLCRPSGVSHFLTRTQLIRTFTLAPLIAMGFASESQHLQIHCFDRFQVRSNTHTHMPASIVFTPGSVGASLAVSIMALS